MMKIINFAGKNKKALIIAGLIASAVGIAAGSVQLIRLIKKRRNDYDFDYSDYCDYDCENCVFQCE